MMLRPEAEAVMAELRHSPTGRPMEHDLRAVLNAISYVTRYGIEWPAPPVDFPSVKAADTVGAQSRGYDAGKRINGHKRHVVVDSLGLWRATGGELPYATAAAFRTAHKVRFTEITKHDSRFSVAELQRQFAYDRILSRCFSADDTDLCYAERAAAPDASVAALARAADRDVGDHLRFELTKTTPLQETGKGRRVHLAAYLGSLYATFHVDVVVDTSPSGEPDSVPHPGEGPGRPGTNRPHPTRRRPRVANRDPGWSDPP